MTPWTVAYQAPPSMGFSRQEYWSGLPFPSPGFNVYFALVLHIPFSWPWAILTDLCSYFSKNLISFSSPRQMAGSVCQCMCSQGLLVWCVRTMARGLRGPEMSSPTQRGSENKEFLLLLNSSNI